VHPLSAEPDDGVDDRARLQAELQAVVYDRNAPGGLQNLLANVRRTAWAARDRLSPDTWRTIHTLTGPAVNDAAEGFDAAETLSYLDQLVRRAAALSGLSAENMTRGPNRLFVDLGRRIERASHLAWLVRQTMARAESGEEDLIRVVLEIADSAMTYRARYLNVFQAAPLIDLLVFDEGNPRAVAFQLDAIAHHLALLPRATQTQRRDGATKLAAEIRAHFAGMDVTALTRPGASGLRAALAHLTADIEVSMSSINDAVTEAYFQHSVRRRTGAARREHG
jgi:uncharacterized alpha-E superfamily protein